MAKRDIEFLFEMSMFRGMDRAWKHWLGPDTANHAEHSFRVAMTALLVATREKKGDHAKILKMALIHDLPESRCVDVDYVQRAYVTRNEDAATEDIFSDTALYADAIPLLREYHERVSIESRIVKDADMLDVDLELSEQIARGQKPLVAQVALRKKQIVSRLYTKTARALWREIHSANPHAWHQNAQRNRFNGGDWQAPKKA